jgi:hypothetical protein
MDRAQSAQTQVSHAETAWRCQEMVYRCEPRRDLRLAILLSFAEFMNPCWCSSCAAAPGETPAKCYRPVTCAGPGATIIESQARVVIRVATLAIVTPLRQRCKEDLRRELIDDSSRLTLGDDSVFWLLAQGPPNHDSRRQSNIPARRQFAGGSSRCPVAIDCSVCNDVPAANRRG